MFPDPASRPARQIMEVPMEPEVLVQCDFMAVIEEGRAAMNFGVTLSNRGVLVGLCTTARSAEARRCGRGVAADGFGLVRRRAVRQPAARCADAAGGGRRPHRTGAARAGLHGLVRAPRSDGVRLRMGLARRDLQRPHAACRLRRRRRGAAVGGGDRGDGDQSRRPAQAHGREHARASPSVDQGQRAVRGQVREVLQHHAGAEADPESLSDLACDQRRAAVDAARRIPAARSSR